MVVPASREIAPNAALLRAMLLVCVACSCAPIEVPADLVFATCGDGACQPGETASNCLTDCGPCATQPSCDDQDPCTHDTCEPTSGCAHKPLSDTTCPDTSPCLANSRCFVGQCIGRQRLWSMSQAVSANTPDYATALALDDGDLVAVGESLRDGPAGKQRDNFLLRLPADASPAGISATPVWIQEDPGQDDTLGGLATLANGGLLAVGARQGQPSVLDKWPASAVRWIVIRPPLDTPEPHHLTMDGSHGLAAVARAGDDSLLAVGFVDNQGLAMRFAPDGQPGWKIAVASPLSGKARLRAVIGLPGAAPKWLAVGEASEVSGKSQGWAVQLAGPGTETTWSVPIAAPEGLHGSLYSAVAMPDAGAVVLGAVAKDAHPDLAPGQGWLWLVRLDAQGAVLWSLQNPQAVAPLVLLRAPNAPRLLVVCGHATHGENEPNTLIQLDFNGRFLASSGLGAEWPLAALTLPDGSLALAGDRDNAGQNDTWLARADPWGHSGCTAAGVCAGLTLTGCDDGNLCTADTCEPTKGCASSPQADDTACGTGQTCKGIVCVKSTN